MKKLIALFSLGLFLFIFSCKIGKKTDKEIESESINAGIGNLQLDKNKEWLVILPGLGCTGCIQEGEAFMRDYVDNNKLFFVLTNIVSLKILQQKIGKSIRDNSNVFIDKNGIFNLHTGNVNYPCIVQLINGRAGEHQFQSPQNGQAFEKLKLKIQMDK